MYTRAGSVDLKMLAETRLAWMGVFYVTVGAAAKQAELYGSISGSMWFMLLAHFLCVHAGGSCRPVPLPLPPLRLHCAQWHVTAVATNQRCACDSCLRRRGCADSYVNACMKGEECVVRMFAAGRRVHC